MNLLNLAKLTQVESPCLISGEKQTWLYRQNLSKGVTKH